MPTTAPAGDKLAVEQNARVRAWPMRWLRMAAGLAYGSVTAVVELIIVAVCGLALALTAPWPAARTRLRAHIDRTAARLAAVELRRLRRYAPGDSTDLPSPSVDGLRRGALGYLAVRAWIGILGGLVLALLVLSVATAATTLAGWAVGFPFPMISTADGVTLTLVALLAVPGAVFFFLAVTGVTGVIMLDRQLAVGMLGPENAAEYRRRIAELASSRAGVVEAVNDERRRIERALHDGVQQNIVMLTLLIGRARRAEDPAKRESLLGQAQAETQRALDELRETAWRIYPSALDTGGLQTALETVTERTALPVSIRYELSARPPRSAETLAYFLISEAITNATKHANASQIRVAVTRDPGAPLRVCVSDDGVGGADLVRNVPLGSGPLGSGRAGSRPGGSRPGGGGLSGLADRAAALDGTVRVDSPAGGPTSITMELPCE